MTQKLKFLLKRKENIAEKVENAGYQHILLFPQCFQKPAFTGSLNISAWVYMYAEHWCILAINPEIRGSIPGLVGNFLRHRVFPTQLEVNWFETHR